MRSVSLMTANQKFAKLMREVERGAVFIITRRGRPVAKLMPAPDEKASDPDWAAAWERMMERLDEGASLGGLTVSREERHEHQGPVLAGYQSSSSAPSIGMPATGMIGLEIWLAEPPSATAR